MINMTRYERLMASIKGLKVDRPPVCFYEINGLDQDPNNKDKFNIYNDPSWRSLIELAKEKSDRIVLREVNFRDKSENATLESTSKFSPHMEFDLKTKESSIIDHLTKVEEYFGEDGSLYRNIKIKIKGHTLTSKTRRDPNADTVWTLEHLIKDIKDFKTWISIPSDQYIGKPDISPIRKAEEELGDSGIVAIDIADPLCEIAELFSMGDYTVMAVTEPELFHKAIEKVFIEKIKKVEAIAKALPGHLWRIYGPEFACPPYLPPRLFKEYVVQYDKPIIDIIKKNGGFPRIHCHGRVKDVLDDIVSTGCIGLDPIEPPPQGDVSLFYVRKNYGDKLVLFGNLELSDIETMEPKEFEKKIIAALEEGTLGEGKGFILMPSASPIGRKLRASTFKNYKRMIELVEEYYY